MRARPRTRPFRARLIPFAIAALAQAQAGPVAAQNKTAGERQLEEDIRDMEARRAAVQADKTMREQLGADLRKSFSGIPQMSSVDPLPVRVTRACARDWDSFAKPRNALPLKMALATNFNDPAGMCRLAPEVKANAEHIRAVAQACLSGTSAQQTYLDRADKDVRAMDALLASAQCVSPRPLPTVALPPSSRAVASAPAAMSGPRTCKAVSRSEVGVAQVALSVENDDLKTTTLLFTRPAVQAGGASVTVDFKVSMGDAADTFQGVGVQVGLPSAQGAPVDMAITIGGVTATREGVSPDAQGRYGARFARGPLKGNGLATAFDAAAEARLVVRAAGKPLLDTTVPLGAAKDREDLGGAALDAADQKLKRGDCA